MNDAFIVCVYARRRAFPLEKRSSEYDVSHVASDKTAVTKWMDCSMYAERELAIAFDVLRLEERSWWKAFCVNRAPALLEALHRTRYA